MSSNQPTPLVSPPNVSRGSKFYATASAERATLAGESIQSIDGDGFADRWPLHDFFVAEFLATAALKSSLNAAASTLSPS
jgi:hypothetical protein